MIIIPNAGGYWHSQRYIALYCTEAMKEEVKTIYLTTFKKVQCVGLSCI